ncbi:MAG: hypothetical protein R2755_21235 [Acidimicrobiales bacterium]
MATPPVHYTRVDGISLAYQVVGDRPIDVILVDEWATPLEGRWDVPAIAGRLDRLASFAQVISFDKRSIGLSDHWPAEEMATPGCGCATWWPWPMPPERSDRCSSARTRAARSPCSTPPAFPNAPVHWCW